MYYGTTNLSRVNIEAGWNALLKADFAADYMCDLNRFLYAEEASGKHIYPPRNEIFNAFEMTPLNKVKVVILGQDPYHRRGQAHGLSFSVRHGVRKPPSLQNIFKELQSDLKIMPPSHGNLEHWAKSGVLLLNSCLTVLEGQATAHAGRGWEKFTDSVINHLNQKKRNLVFILWGRQAQKKGININHNRHLVLTSPHPSPLAAYSGFFGSRPFSKTNAYLTKHQLAPISWDVRCNSLHTT